jgi:hypothetical protein
MLLSLCHPDRSERTLATRNDLGQLRAAKPVPVPNLRIQLDCHPERSEISREARHSRASGTFLSGRGRRIPFDASGEGPNSKFRSALSFVSS